MENKKELKREREDEVENRVLERLNKFNKTGTVKFGNFFTWNGGRSLKITTKEEIAKIAEYPLIL